MSGAPTASAAARGSKRRYYREAEERGSKRSRWAERDGSDEMDVEDEAWGRGAGEGRRGVKRSAREGGGEAKRTRREVEEEEQEQEIDGMDLGEEESERTGEEEDEGRRTESPRKRRARSTESDRSVKVRSASKRPRSGVRTKPSSKRAIDDVDQSSEEFEDADDTDGVRNADSDLGSGDEEDGSLGLKETSPSATLSSSDRPSADRKRGGKRSRSVGRRRNSDDEDVMGGTMDDVMPASRSAPNKSLAQPAGWKRTALSNNRASTANGRASQAGKAPVPTAGVTWTDYEGVLFKIDEAGNRRRLCEVKEIRKKFKMVRLPVFASCSHSIVRPDLFFARLAQRSQRTPSIPIATSRTRSLSSGGSATPSTTRRCSPAASPGSGPSNPRSSPKRSRLHCRRKLPRRCGPFLPLSGYSSLMPLFVAPRPRPRRSTLQRPTPKDGGLLFAPMTTSFVPRRAAERASERPLARQPSRTVGSAWSAARRPRAPRPVGPMVRLSRCSRTSRRPRRSGSEGGWRVSRWEERRTPSPSRKSPRHHQW